VTLFSVVRKRTASRENRRQLLGDDVMNTASHHIAPVMPLCCYGKVLDFMIKNTRFVKKH